MNYWLVFIRIKITINDHSTEINEHELNIPSCFDTLKKIEGNSNECLEVIYDSYFDIEDIDLSSLQLNPHDKSLITCENEENYNLEYISRVLTFKQLIILMISAFNKPFQSMIYMMMKITFIFRVIPFSLIHKWVSTIILITLFYPILVKMKLL